MSSQLAARQLSSSLASSQHAVRNARPARLPAAVTAAEQRTTVVSTPSMREVPAGTSLGSPTISTVTPTSTSTQPKPAPTYRVSLWDAMAFNGRIPETVNGRLAMVGILAAAVRESQTGETVAALASHMSPVTVAALLVLVYASIVPVLKGARMEPFGPFTPKAEKLNGRAAMLGFAVLLALEYKSGVCFF